MHSLRPQQLIDAFGLEGSVTISRLNGRRYFHALFRIGGRQFNRSTGCDDYGSAKIAAAKIFAEAATETQSVAAELGTRQDLLNEIRELKALVVALPRSPHGPYPDAPTMDLATHAQSAVHLKSIEEAKDEFLSAREPHISASALRDYRRTLNRFADSHPARRVNTVTAADVEAFLKAQNVGRKRFNNMRGDLHAFFNFCLSPARRWTRENPVVGTTKFKIARGIPAIITTEKAAELMAYLETYSCGARAKHTPGCLVPYFALCLFAGLRPSADDGEIRKLGESPDMEKLVDRKLGVIRITPEISKVGTIRQVKIRENLAAWLTRYPLDRFPIILPNMQDKVSEVRKHFDLTSDVLRHTFISNHVAKWQSLGAAALEAGNSEAMIRRHYLNLVSDEDAAAFWAIVPSKHAKITAAATWTISFFRTIGPGLSWSLIERRKIFPLDRNSQRHSNENRFSTIPGQAPRGVSAAALNAIVAGKAINCPAGRTALPDGVRAISSVDSHDGLLSYSKICPGPFITIGSGSRRNQQWGDKSPAIQVEIELISAEKPARAFGSTTNASLSSMFSTISFA